MPGGPRVPPQITLSSLFEVVRQTINFNRYSGGRAEEVEYDITERMLATKF